MSCSPLKNACLRGCEFQTTYASHQFIFCNKRIHQKHPCQHLLHHLTCVIEGSSRGCLPIDNACVLRRKQEPPWHISLKTMHSLSCTAQTHMRSSSSLSSSPSMTTPCSKLYLKPKEICMMQGPKLPTCKPKQTPSEQSCSKQHQHLLPQLPQQLQLTTHIICPLPPLLTQLTHHMM